MMPFVNDNKIKVLIPIDEIDVNTIPLIKKAELFVIMDNNE